jgi:hypothetical protein
MTEQVRKSNESFWRWWPFFVGGLCGPLLGDLLYRWLPLHFAVGVAMFIVWLIVLFIFNRISPSSNWSILRWVGASMGVGIISGVLAFLFPWK